ncbi:hypothetical protein [Staphylospora marina]|uniref:hypothetical protein n=1 Tax=Staphylospora marina TaxID=2490858 RepID=UPI000F5BC442|nr:hypothetical protein [Staphylospora marina]
MRLVSQLTDFILFTPEETSERLKRYYPDVNETRLELELICFRYFIVDLQLYAKHKENPNIKSSISNEIKENIQTVIKFSSGEEAEEQFFNLLRARYMEYAAVLQERPENLTDIVARFVAHVDDKEFNTGKEFALETREVFWEFIRQTKSLLGDVNQLEGAESAIDSKEEDSGYTPILDVKRLKRWIKMVKTVAYLVMILGIFTTFRFYVDDSIIWSVVTGLVTLRQMTTIHAIGNFSMKQQTEQNALASLGIIILFILSLL